MMTQMPPQDITTETLKELTNAPEVDEPLVTPDAFEPQETQPSRPLWKLPLPRLVLVGVALMPVFAIAGYFLIGNQQSKPSQQIQRSPQPNDSSSTDDTATDEVEQLRQENAELKAESALDGQGQLLAQQQTLSNSSDSSDELSVEPSEDEPVPPSNPVPTRATTPVNRRSPPPQIQSAPPPRTTTRLSRPSETEQPDPFEYWNQLARLGSYGTISPPETLSAETSSIETPSAETTDAAPTASTDTIAEPEILVASAHSVPIAQVAPTSAVQSSAANSFEPTSPASLDSPVSRPEMIDLEASGQRLPGSDSPILHEAEAAVLEGRPRMHSLIAGTSANGTLSTPVILEQTHQGDRFLVKLHDPLLDNQGQVAVPAGSELLVAVNHVSEDGMVQLSAVGVRWLEAEGQRELVIPPRVIQIRGEDGDPLMAERFDDPGGAIAAMDAGQFFLGAVRRTAELYTRSDTRVQTGNGTTVVTEENPDPNIVAGLLEGGTDAILDTIADRNSRAIAQMENRSPIWFVEAGTPIQVFVNQSMQLPM